MIILGKNILGVITPLRVRIIFIKKDKNITKLDNKTASINNFSKNPNFLINKTLFLLLIYLLLFLLLSILLFWPLC